MPMWRCPHCGTPQREAARCWVCRRSSTTCSTCRHFRRSLAATVGYCGLDRGRAPLVGTELRGCWTEALRATDPDGDDRAAKDEPERPIPPVVRRLRPDPRPGILEGFVPVEHLDRGPRTLRPIDPPDRTEAPPPAVIEVIESWADRDSLFGDL